VCLFPDLPVQKQPVPQEVFGSLKKAHEDDDDDDDDSDWHHKSLDA
jgi:hypothetical protein